MKCDFFGKDSKKLKTIKNFPHGKKSKGITTRICNKCEQKENCEVEQ